MHRRVGILLAILALTLAAATPARAMTREEIRQAWRETQSAECAYSQEPVVRGRYAAGALTEETLAASLSSVNLFRKLAGLPEVAGSAIYDMYAQHGAVLLAALNEAMHSAPRPQDMPENFYDTARKGTLGGNLASLNWTGPGVLRQALMYFARDDGADNLSELPHRRWLLNPKMAETGFGLAQSPSGVSFAVMYAVDMGAEAAPEAVFWPGEGDFPAELMGEMIPWSVSLSPEEFDIDASSPIIDLTERTSGASFHFDFHGDGSDGYRTISTAQYGWGPCLIFRPDLAGTDLADYEQNQVWHLRVSGLVRTSGEEAALEMTCRMISLSEILPVSVEISALEARLSVGERLALSARVIPAYADDLSLRWRSSDEAVATVSEDGTVTAVGAGECRITAASVNGREDACALTVALP